MPANNQIFLEVLDPQSVVIDGLLATMLIITPNDPGISYKLGATSTTRDGGLVFDFTGYKLPMKYEYYATILVSKQDVGLSTYLDSSIRKTIRLTDVGDGVQWTAIDLGSWSVPVVEATISIATKKVEVRNAYDAYVTAKAAYDAVIAGANTIELEQLEPYEPVSPTNIVTRLLEFQTGTLTPAIRYATDAQLGEQLEYLNRINRFVNLYVALYPSITIDDGEGIPYSQ